MGGIGLWQYYVLVLLELLIYFAEFQLSITLK